MTDKAIVSMNNYSGIILECIINRKNETGSATMKQCILISGPTIALDVELVSQLQKTATVLTNLENGKIESIIAHSRVDLILLEVEKENRSEIEIIKNIKLLYPDIKIIPIGTETDRDLIAKAFEYGARDAFRKPYKIALIVDRVKALLRLK